MYEKKYYAFVKRTAARDVNSTECACCCSVGGRRRRSVFFSTKIGSALSSNPDTVYRNALFEYAHDGVSRDRNSSVDLPTTTNSVAERT